MSAIILGLIFGLSLIGILIQGSKKSPQKIFGIYSQPGKWFYLKYVTLICLLSLRKVKSKWFRGKSGLASNVKTSIENLEQFQPLSNNEKAFDAVFFQACNKEGFYLCGGLERRHKGKANGLLYLVVPGLGLLRSKKIPNTLLNQDPVAMHLGKKYAAEGIEFEPIEPMKTWKVVFNGEMSLKTEPNKFVDVQLEAEWTNDKFPYFMFDSDLSIKAIARAIAREEWNKKLFENLKRSHQSHYEQMGVLTAKLTVDKKQYNIKMDAFRDHSFGYKRDWTLMHRYAFHMIYLENGTRVSLGVICQPCTTSHLEVGYIALPSKQIYPIDNCDLLLYQHGERGNPGKNIGFSFMANGEIYDVKVSTNYECEHFKGNDIEARLIERFNTYEVNGIKGKGISEWQYKNIFD